MSMCYWCQQKPYCQEMNSELYESIDQGKIYCKGFTQVGLPDISMGRTTPSWVSENKSVTRRNWSTPTMRRFKKDATYLAWSRQPRYGGEPLGIGRMTADAFREKTGVHNTHHKLEEFYEAEGFQYLDNKHSEKNWGCPLFDSTQNWIKADLLVAVVPFKIVEVFPGIKEKYTTDEEIIRCVKALVRAIG